MTHTFRVGLVQMTTGRDVAKNLADASKLIRDAAKAGAQYVQTPEVTTLIESDYARLFVATRPEDGNPALAHFQALARELKIWQVVNRTRKVAILSPATKPWWRTCRGDRSA